MQDNQLQSSELLRLSIIYRASVHFQISERRLDLGIVRIVILPAFDNVFVVTLYLLIMSILFFFQ